MTDHLDRVHLAPLPTMIWPELVDPLVDIVSRSRVEQSCPGLSSPLNSDVSTLVMAEIRAHSRRHRVIRIHYVLRDSKPFSSARTGIHELAYGSMLSMLESSSAEVV